MMMMMIRALLLSAITVAATSSAMAEKPDRSAAINFADQGGIADWLVRTDQGIFLMDRTGQWYYASFRGPCWNLKNENTLGFVPGPGGRFDQFSAVRTSFGSCSVETLEQTQRPAEKGLKGRP